MAEPWFDPVQFGAWYGAIMGSFIGIMGGVIGVLGRLLAPRGIGRRWVLGLMYAMVVAGVAQLLFGGYALLVGQPYGIWYPPLLCGGLSTVIVGALVPMARQRYREAESRRMEAEGIRKSFA